MIKLHLYSFHCGGLQLPPRESTKNPEVRRNIVPGGLQAPPFSLSSTLSQAPSSTVNEPQVAEQSPDRPALGSSLPTAAGSEKERPPGRSSSYGQILRSSSIIGGAQGINYLIGMVRTKLVAVLLGPSGVGLVGLYQSATGLVGTVSGLGLDQSGVRDVAAAHGAGSPDRIAHTVKTLRRMCWLTGIAGWLLTAALSYPLSLWVFGSGEHAWAVAALGITLLFGAVSRGQISIIQGTRRIGDIARLNVIGAIAGTIVAVGVYAWLGQRGIVPVLILTAAFNLGASWWFARRIQTAQVAQSWRQTISNSRQLVSIGTAFMYGAVLASVVGLAIRSLIVRQLGLEANGIYQGAWAISGMFAGFVLSAMGTDFYPRLTAVAGDNEEVNRLVNEQIEIGVLLALPGLMATLAFAGWAMHIFYSARFAEGGRLLPWFALGAFWQVASWPMGMVQMAKGAAGWMYVGRTSGNVLHLGLTLVLLELCGLVGVAWAFAAFSFLHGLIAFWIARRISNYAWGSTAIRRFLLAAAFLVTGLAAQAWLSGFYQITSGFLITASACIYSLRGISASVGETHRIVRIIKQLPCGRFICGLRA